MDQLHDIRHSHLRNIYFALRHGRSIANDEEVIVSDPREAIRGYGLSEEGRRQVAGSVTEAMRNGLLDATTLIVTSDFARARQSAEIAAEMLGARDIIVTPKLRERFFGKWEKEHHSNYLYVWERDALDGASRHDGVESTRDVLARTTALVRDLERKYDGRTILLVSHGDPLQILQTAFEGLDSGSHRLVPPIETGQIRRLELKATRL